MSWSYECFIVLSGRNKLSNQSFVTTTYWTSATNDTYIFCQIFTHASASCVAVGAVDQTIVGPRVGFEIFWNVKKHHCVHNQQSTFIVYYSYYWSYIVMFTVIYWGGQIIFFPGWGGGGVSPPGFPPMDECKLHQCIVSLFWDHFNKVEVDSHLPLNGSGEVRGSLANLDSYREMGCPVFSGGEVLDCGRPMATSSAHGHFLLSRTRCDGRPTAAHTRT